jgi:pyroglutamyl-peptidase
MGLPMTPEPRLISLLLLASMASGCAIDGGPGQRNTPTDPRPHALYRDFMDGKMDGAGHPIGAAVFEAESECRAQTGWPSSSALDLDAQHDDAGRACSGSTEELGAGPYVVNVRGAMRQGCDGEACAPLLTVRALDAGGELLSERGIGAADFIGDNTYENIALHFRLETASTVRFEVSYGGVGALTIDYIEIFRKGRQLVLSPASGVLDAEADLRIEIVDPPSRYELRVSCDGLALDARLEDMLENGEATEEQTDFRRILTIPAGLLLQECPETTQVVVALHSNRQVRATSEVRYVAQGSPCAFEGDGSTRVLVTGFVPFPAGSSNDNSSMEGVLAFDPSAVPDARVMKLILPVEFEGAAAWASDVIARCEPEVVIGFGQGGQRVALEWTAYNRRDTSEVPGGIPDNRGLVVEPTKIHSAGPDTFRTELPIETIEADLRRANIDVELSDDPGRYVCNDLFYSLSSQDAANERTIGFVHMPYVRHVDDRTRGELASVVESVIRRSVAAHPTLH